MLSPLASALSASSDRKHELELFAFVGLATGSADRIRDCRDARATQSPSDRSPLSAMADIEQGHRWSDRRVLDGADRPPHTMARAVVPVGGRPPSQYWPASTQRAPQLLHGETLFLVVPGLVLVLLAAAILWELPPAAMVCGALALTLFSGNWTMLGFPGSRSCPTGSCSSQRCWRCAQVPWRRRAPPDPDQGSAPADAHHRALRPRLGRAGEHDGHQVDDIRPARSARRDPVPDVPRRAGNLLGPARARMATCHAGRDRCLYRTDRDLRVDRSPLAGLPSLHPRARRSRARARRPPARSPTSSPRDSRATHARWRRSSRPRAGVALAVVCHRSGRHVPVRQLPHLRAGRVDRCRRRRPGRCRARPRAFGAGCWRACPLCALAVIASSLSCRAFTPPRRRASTASIRCGIGQNQTVAALNMIQTKPLFGFGFDNWANTAAPYFRLAANRLLTGFPSSAAMLRAGSASSSPLDRIERCLRERWPRAGRGSSARQLPVLRRRARPDRSDPLAGLRALGAWAAPSSAETATRTCARGGSGSSRVGVCFLVLCAVDPLLQNFTPLILWTWAGVAAGRGPDWRYPRHAVRPGRRAGRAGRGRRRPYPHMTSSTASPSRRRVLMFAYYFPPLGGGGVQRTAKYVKYLPSEGFEPILVTGTPRGFPAARYQPVAGRPARNPDPARACSAATDGAVEARWPAAAPRVTDEAGRRGAVAGQPHRMAPRGDLRRPARRARLPARRSVQHLVPDHRASRCPDRAQAHGPSLGGRLPRFVAVQSARPQDPLICTAGARERGARAHGGGGGLVRDIRRRDHGARAASSRTIHAGS